MKVTSTRDINLDHIYALVHGDSGSGKTTSFKTLPPRDTLLVAADIRASLLPLRQCEFDVCEVTELAHLRELAGELTANKCVLNGKRYEIVAVDGLTGISEIVKKEIIRLERPKLLKQRTGRDLKTPDGIYDDQLTQEDWGAFRTKMWGLLSSLCHLPACVICTVQSHWRDNKRDGGKKIIPGIGGKSGFEAPGFFDLVLYMHSKTQTDDGDPGRLWQTFDTEEVSAKDSSGVLDAFEEPDWSAIFNKIKEGKTNG